MATIDHMIKSGHPPLEIFNMWNSLHLEGWNSDEKNLPREWKKKYNTDTSSYTYLSPMMEVIASEDDLMETLSSNGCSKEDMQKVEKWCRTLNK